MGVLIFLVSLYFSCRYYKEAKSIIMNKILSNETQKKRRE